MPRFFTLLVLLVLLVLLLSFLSFLSFLFFLSFSSLLCFLLRTSISYSLLIGDHPREIPPPTSNKTTDMPGLGFSQKQQASHSDCAHGALGFRARSRGNPPRRCMPVSLLDRIGLRQLRATGPRSAPTGCCSWSPRAHLVPHRARTKCALSFALPFVSGLSISAAGTPQPPRFSGPFPP